ncbi:hypothetical protein [Streptomyces wuyuanensis]|uniref:hypothetical protein n=1 Tax=Streptomyces wuyuanensis TaxID=1196353 RepID=UPI003D71698E
MRRSTTVFIAAAALLTAGTGCGSRNAPTDGSVARATTATVTPTVEEPPTEDAAKDSSDTPSGLTDRVTYENDVQVALAKFARGVSGEYASPENTPYVKFEIKITNGSDGTIDTTSMTVNCQYGEEGQLSETIFDESHHGGALTHLVAGRSITVPFACELPKEQTVIQIEVAPDIESEAAIFTGNVK